MEQSTSLNRFEVPRDRFLKQFRTESYPELLASSGIRIENNETFDLISLTPRGSVLTLKFQLGEYFNYLNYYDLLGKEVCLLAMGGKLHQYFPVISASALPRSFVLRDSVPTTSEYLLKDFTERPVKLGVNVFVLARRPDGGYSTFVQKRGETQFEYPGFRHVVPAGTFQPLSVADDTTIESQFSLSYTVLRELLEEIYDLEEADKASWSDPFRIFELEVGAGSDFFPGRYLFDSEIENVEKPLADETRNYKIVYTGFLVDLVTLKPELTCVLVLKNPDLYKFGKKYVKGNWEGLVADYPLEHENFSKFCDRYLNVDLMLPAGVAAVAEGLDYYAKHVRPTSDQN